MRPVASAVPAAYRSAVAILAVALAACGGDVAAPSREPYVVSFDRLWSTVDREYAHFPVKGVDWDSIGGAARVRAQRVATDDEFRSLAREVLSELRDVHVWLVAPDGRRVGTWQPSYRSNWSPALLRERRRGVGWREESPALAHGVVSGVPYIAVRSWNGATLSLRQFDAVLARYRSAPALIVDLRMNAGGDEALALQVAGRFADAPRIATFAQYRRGPRHDDFTSPVPRLVHPSGAWRYTRPVVLLVGRGSWSASESVVAAMRDFPHVTVVGDTTGGGSGSPALFPLRAGWGVALSRRVEFTAAGAPIEGVGIAPDVVVPAHPSALAAGDDETLRAALALLTARRSSRTHPTARTARGRDD